MFVGGYLGAAFGTRLVFPEIETAVLFPPYAVLTAALLLAPIRWWGLLIAAAAAGNFAPHHAFEQSISFVAIAEVANITRALVAAGGIRFLASRTGDPSGGRSSKLDALPAMAVFILFAGLVGPMAGALVGAADVVLHRADAAFWLAFRAWLLSNVLTGLTLLPLILVVATYPFGSRRISGMRLVEAAALAFCVVAVVIDVLMQTPNDGLSLAPYQPLPFLFWAAVRFGPAGTIAALSAVSVPMIYASIEGTGPFVGQAPGANLLQLQSFLITLNGPFLLLAAVVQERATAARALAQSRSHYRSIVEDQTEAICRYTADGTFTFVNDACCRQLARPRESLLGKTIWEFMPENDHDAIRDFLASITADHPVATLEHSVVTSDGETVWYQWTTRGFFDEDGRVVELQAVGRDVTEQKRAEEAQRELEARRQAEIALRASEERFRLLADNAPVLIWMAGLDNEATHFNKTWLDFTGRSLDDELGFGWAESIHPDDRERCIETCNAAFAQRAPLTMQFRLRRHDGEYRWLLDNGIPHVDADGTFKGYIGTCVDITEQRMAEEVLEEAARRKDEFLAMLGHELRNPLAPIGLAVEILRMRPADDESVGWARQALTRQLSLLSRLVDDLLDVSRISRGTIRLNDAAIDFADVVADAVETSRPLIAARGHVLLLDVPTEPLPMRGDSARLVQVISNLLNNAARYTDPGGRIGLSVHRVDDRVELRVSDSGVGIPAERLSEIFEMFRQVDDHSEGSKGGLGIGLTLVKKIVELHGGTIEARSPGAGLGSEFIVTLPCAAAGAADGARAEAVAAGAAAPAEGAEHKRILIVDDNVDAATGLELILRHHGHAVDVVHDGPAALAAAARFDPEVVLLDIGLPGMSGLEVARRLKASPSRSAPLLIATTGFGQARDRRRAAEAGFDHHLTKPIDLALLMSLIEHAEPRIAPVQNSH